MRLTEERTKKVKVPGDPDGAFINIRALTLNEIDRIEEKATSITFGDDEGTVQLKPFKRSNNMALACLKGWGGFFDIKGKELKFNRANLNKAANFEVEIDGKRFRFFEWVDEEHEKFRKEVTEEEKVAIKN